MIQINLLPDVKLQYLRTQRNKRLVIGAATLVSIVAASIVALLALHVYVNQALHTDRLQDDIDSARDQFIAIDDLDTVLTVREQLLELESLHNSLPDATRLPALLAKIVPNSVELTEMAVDFEGLTIRLSGQAVSTKTINTFADILKNTFFAQGDGSSPKLAFSAVEFEIGVRAQNAVSFDAEMMFDSTLFDPTIIGLEITIPTIVSTQSAIRSSIFESPTEEVEQ